MTFKYGFRLNGYIGKYLPHSISDNFNTLNGADIAQWLESIGYTVDSYSDTKSNGLAITSTGISVSSNGYVSRFNPNE